MGYCTGTGVYGYVVVVRDMYDVRVCGDRSGGLSVRVGRVGYVWVSGGRVGYVLWVCGGHKVCMYAW